MNWMRSVRLPNSSKCGETLVGLRSASRWCSKMSYFSDLYVRIEEDYFDGMSPEQLYSKYASKGISENDIQNVIENADHWLQEQIDSAALD